MKPNWKLEAKMPLLHERCRVRKGRRRVRRLHGSPVTWTRWSIKSLRSMKRTKANSAALPSTLIGRRPYVPTMYSVTRNKRQSTDPYTRHGVHGSTDSAHITCQSAQRIRRDRGRDKRMKARIRFVQCKIECSLVSGVHGRTDRCITVHA
jgi:hypothetical protein